jgi:co-chaperonin GroES (HSP10)
MEQVINGWVLVKTAKEEVKSKSGIVLSAGEGTENDNIGIVAYMAKSEYDERLNIGDRILYSKYAGEVVMYKGEQLKAIKASDIYMIL